MGLCSRGPGVAQQKGDRAHPLREWPDQPGKIISQMGTLGYRQVRLLACTAPGTRDLAPDSSASSLSAGFHMSMCCKCRPGLPPSQDLPVTASATLPLRNLSFVASLVVL